MIHLIQTVCDFIDRSSRNQLLKLWFKNTMWGKIPNGMVKRNFLLFYREKKIENPPFYSLDHY